MFITLDKMDKIGLDGVAAELEENRLCERIGRKISGDYFEEITNDVYGRPLSVKRNWEAFWQHEAADGTGT